MLAWDTPQQQSVLGNLTKNMPIMWSNKTVSITHNITVISYKLYKVCSVIYTVSTVLRLQVNTLLGPMMLSFAQVLPTWGSLHDKVRLCVAANASRIQRYILIIISVLQPCSTCPNIILPPTNSKHQSRMNQVLSFPSNKSTHWRRDKQVKSVKVLTYHGVDTFQTLAVAIRGASYKRKEMANTHHFRRKPCWISGKGKILKQIVISRKWLLIECLGSQSN